MKIAVCEDEKVFSDLLFKLLTEYFSGHGETAEITVFSDGIPLIEAFSKGERYELVFLDIQLLETDGMETAAKLRNYDNSFEIIFVTSLTDRAVEGYAVSAFDYVVKSSLESRLPAALDRFMNKHRTEMITLPGTGGETLITKVSDILWFESEGRGTAAGMNDRTVSMNIPVGKFSSMIPEGRFTEVHKSVFVQTVKIKSIGTDTVEMINGKTFPLSRRKRKEVMTAVMDAVRGASV